MHSSLHTLLLGTADAKSPLSKLAGHSDVIQLIWELVTQKWERELMAETMAEQEVAFAHVNNVHFPPPKGLNVNMMPFVMDQKNSLPKELHGYWSMIELCVRTLARQSERRVVYLTVHESVVVEGTSQRRPGLHTEGFMRAPCDSGTIKEMPRWHPWGFGHPIGKGKFEGGIFMASTVSDSTHIYNALVPKQLIGKGGDVEHLREVLNEHFPDRSRSRTRWPDDPERYDSHANCARGHMHLAGDDIFDQQPVRGPISLQADELVWFTDRTPHESVPLAAGQPRQFFRLVTGGIDTWYAAHSTPNPLGVKPQATVVTHDKFTGKTPPSAFTESATPEGGSPSTAKLSDAAALRSALLEAEAAAAGAGSTDARDLEAGSGEADLLTAEELFGSDEDD